MTEMLVQTHVSSEEIAEHFRRNENEFWEVISDLAEVMAPAGSQGVQAMASCITDDHDHMKGLAFLDALVLVAKEKLGVGDA